MLEELPLGLSSFVWGHSAALLLKLELVAIEFCLVSFVANFFINGPFYLTLWTQNGKRMQSMNAISSHLPDNEQGSP